MTEHLSHNRPPARFVRPQSNELTKRIISALVLGAVGLGATAAGSWALAILVALVSAVLAWEWGRLVRNCAFDDLLYIHVTALLAAIAFATVGWMQLALLTLAAGGIAIALMRSKEYVKLSGLGVPYIGIAAVGIIWLRAADQGFAAVIFVFACVWAHDSIAMFAGRAIGGPRLWPAISPKKTWSGAIAGLTASMLVGLATHLALPSTNVLWLTALAFALGFAALIGDLAESSLKRLGRVKNASGLIPGHGGFLDRLDGAIASFALACLIALTLNPTSPAQALLLGH